MQPMEYSENSIFHTPLLTWMDRGGLHLAIDGATPNWVATDERGARILRLIDGRRDFGEIVREYAARTGLDSTRAWVHVDGVMKECLRQGLVGRQAFSNGAYGGRASYLADSPLAELWVHTNNSCNLTCTHCLVGSGPGGDKGLPLDRLLTLLDEAHSLGVRRFYFTGGEPFVRKDIFELIRKVTEDLDSELILLTNATLFGAERGRRLESLKREKVRFQVSVDGATAAINDAIRGEGSFEAIGRGLQTLTSLGFAVTATCVVTRGNIHDIPGLVDLARVHGVEGLHLMWLHKRGRILEEGEGSFPSNAELISLTRKVKKLAGAAGVRLDNFESARYRVNGRPGVRYDLGNAGVESLCVYSDGKVYPSAALANHAPVLCGDTGTQSLGEIWRGSPVCRKVRKATLIRKTGAHEDALRFFTGGGDIEHSFLFSEALHGTGDWEAQDPYYELGRTLCLDAMFELAQEGRRAVVNGRSGYNVPPLYHAMGRGAVVCGSDDVDITTDQEVRTLHSNCVLSFDVEKPHRIVQTFYGEAAHEPKPGLCCPDLNAGEDLSFIPEAVTSRSFGCGSPITMAGVQAGERVIDLGSGGGIDCFLASKKVGPQGEVVGVDMTDPMLAIANENNPLVAEKLGYSNVTFHKGYMEELPVEDGRFDLLTSNCVINLSPDKRKVFSEMWRVLADHGRIVVSDIVSEGPIPPHLAVNSELWGECMGGALTREEFLTLLEQAGFYGLSVIKSSFWREVMGYRFHSVTVRGYKFEKTAGCRFVGQWAIYHGPWKAVIDEEGHLFPREQPVEICTDTAAKLSHAPYAGQFTLVGSGPAQPAFTLSAASQQAPEVLTAPSNGSGGDGSFTFVEEPSSEDATCQPGCC